MSTKYRVSYISSYYYRVKIMNEKQTREENMIIFWGEITLERHELYFRIHR